MAAAAPSEKRSTLRTPSAIPTRPAAEIDLDAYGSDVEGRGNKAESVRLPRTAEVISDELPPSPSSSARNSLIGTSKIANHCESQMFASGGIAGGAHARAGPQRESGRRVRSAPCTTAAALIHCVAASLTAKDTQL